MNRKRYHKLITELGGVVFCFWQWAKIVFQIKLVNKFSVIHHFVTASFQIFFPATQNYLIQR